MCRRMDRYAARSVKVVLVLTRIAVQGARRAPRNSDNEPGRGPTFPRRRPWLAAGVCLLALASAQRASAQAAPAAKDPEPQSAAPLAKVDSDSELATTPSVAPASPADRAKRRRVLGTKKNPASV